MTSTRKGSAEAMASIPHTRLPDEESIAEYYNVGVKLGQGSFGKVHEATHIKTDEKRAIKSINKEKAGSSALKLLEREVAILKRVNHPNIIRLFEVLETPKRMFLVMEVCEGGELADALKEMVRFSESQAKGIMTKLASAISYLHKHDIVHRDLKLENILLTHSKDSATEEFDIRVTDFGLSVTKGGVTPDNMMQDFCGTPMYMAPEIIDNKTYSQQCDVWAMGVIMYLLLSGSSPFKSKDEESLYELIRQGELDFSEDVWSSISEEAKRCLRQMMKVDPAYRLSAAEVLEEPWISGKPRDHSRPANVLDMMKQWGPEMRKPTSSDVVNGQEEEEQDRKVEENGPSECNSKTSQTSLSKSSASKQEKSEESRKLVQRGVPYKMSCSEGRKSSRLGLSGLKLISPSSVASPDFSGVDLGCNSRRRSYTYNYPSTSTQTACRKRIGSLTPTNSLYTYHVRNHLVAKSNEEVGQVSSVLSTFSGLRRSTDSTDSGARGSSGVSKKTRTPPSSATRHAYSGSKGSRLTVNTAGTPRSNVATPKAGLGPRSPVSVSGSGLVQKTSQSTTGSKLAAPNHKNNPSTNNSSSKSRKK